ncbi:MAG: PIN domain-containing protein [Holophagales bacterium]|jgi:predicted nucleic acid-binding protein|nr:PIN domain-containing protein [Holophagales bacterium]
MSIERNLVLAVISEEPGYETVCEAYQETSEGKAKLIMHTINLTEVYATIHKREGREKANEILETIKTDALIEFHSDPDFSDSPDFDCKTDTRFLETFSELRAQYGTHFSDTFVLATNKIYARNGIILTSDRGFEKFRQTNPNNLVYFH